MKIAFTTVDLFEGCEYLMPWRTIIEVVKGMKNNGIDADIITVPVISPINHEYEFQNLIIKSAPRNFIEFGKFIERNNYDVLIYPTPLRESLKKEFKAFANIKCKKIAYIPGGIYKWDNIISLWYWGGFNAAKPYIIDKLTPYSYFLKTIKECGFEAIVSLSPYTAHIMQENGYKKSICILPGKDNFEFLEEDLNVFSKLGINKKEEYMLFTGAPAPTRGAQVLIKACMKLSHYNKKNKLPKIIFLMRHDVGSNFTSFQKAYNNMPNKYNTQLITERVNRNELKTLIAHARGVLLPFLIIPSEIPITFFEVMSLGIPIITFDNNGTTEYLNKGLLKCKSGDVNQLAINILNLYQQNELYKNLSVQASKLMKEHPTWDKVTHEWIELVTSLNS